MTYFTPAEMGQPENLTTINGPDGKPVFDIFVYPKVKTVCISPHDKDVNLVYEINWSDWVKVSDLLMQRMQSHK